MTSALEGGGGSPKSSQKEQNMLISVPDRGRGIFEDDIYGSPFRGSIRSGKRL